MQRAFHKAEPGKDDMEFFVHHRNRLVERHWAYMDRFQAQMIARGSSRPAAKPPSRCTTGRSAAARPEPSVVCAGARGVSEGRWHDDVEV